MARSERVGATGAQNRLMWGLVANLRRQGLSAEDAEDVLRRITEEVSGQRSTRALSASQVSEVIERLRMTAEGGQEPRPRPTITPKLQGGLDLIRAELGFTPQDYAAFSRRMLGRPWPQTNDDGIMLYEGMEAMLRRRFHPRWLAPHIETLTAQAHTFSAADRQFVTSIRLSLKKRKPLGAGQIGILRKIGGRYGYPIPPDPDAR